MERYIEARRRFDAARRDVRYARRDVADLGRFRGFGAHHRETRQRAADAERRVRFLRQHVYNERRRYQLGRMMEQRVPSDVARRIMSFYSA